MIIIYVVAIVLALIVIYTFITYNQLVSLKTMVSEAFSTMDVYLKKRWDLVPNLVSTVKGYAAHEESVLTEIVEARNKGYDEMSQKEKIESNTNVNTSINKIMAIAEKYPELKASQNFIELSKQLIQIEDDIANARKYYNGTVKNMNLKVQKFPSNLVAKTLGYKSIPMFEIEESEKENIKVEL